jgi:OTT_1508-like deaminase
VSTEIQLTRFSAKPHSPSSRSYLLVPSGNTRKDLFEGCPIRAAGYTLSHKHHQLDPKEDTPPRSIADTDVSNQLTKLIQLCLEFSFSRLQKRINTNFDRFLTINNPDPGKPKPMIIRFHSLATEDDVGLLDANKARPKPENARPSLVDDGLDVVFVDNLCGHILSVTTVKEPLINDPRLKELHLSLGIRMLQVAGMQGFECEYTEHPFQIVRRWVIVLERIYTRDKGAKIEKPDDTKKWVELWKCLKMTKVAINKFLDDGGFRAEDVAGAQTFLGSYLRKVESLTNDIEVLMKLANSPQCKQFFTFEFKVTPLRGQVVKASVPQTPKDWEIVFEKALLFRNASRVEEEEYYVIDTKKIEEDTAHMAKDTIKLDLIIHCEVRILLHIFKTETGSTPKAYTYVGVSKLSCRGCLAFFESFNRVHQTRFVTPWSHNKSYLQWQFPHSVPESDMVLFHTYHSIARRWVGFYDGYRVKQTSLAPDSTEQTGTSSSYAPDLITDSTEQTDNQDENAYLNSVEMMWAEGPWSKSGQRQCEVCEEKFLS